jgi:hypothetical protein
LVDYPRSFSTSTNELTSIATLYLFPRVITGFLAIADTFLIFKIAERKYNRNVAFYSSILFAVMPITWLTRWVVLENISLPFVLLSVFFAILSKDSLPGHRTRHNRYFLITFLSGAFLGLAIFTKSPSFTLIPLIGFIIFSNASQRNLKVLGIWLTPIILLPMIWPIYAATIGQFDLWLEGVDNQMHRGSKTFFYSIEIIMNFDPILPILGASGLIFTIIKRDFFILLWTVPFLIFLYGIGFVSYWHLIPLLPPLCISAGNFIEVLARKVKHETIRQTLPFVAIASLGVFGMAYLLTIIITGDNSSYIQAEASLFDILVWKITRAE